MNEQHHQQIEEELELKLQAAVRWEPAPIDHHHLTEDNIVNTTITTTGHYRDREEEVKAEHASYLWQHPVLRAMMADFLQFLLLPKLSDVLMFAFSLPLCLPLTPFITSSP
ncbi:unnamed protein product [Coregonus sp. 'balchen']|nr:unnamed protein product [Coregonus sp. 'balchen']